MQPARRVHHGLGPESRVCPPPASPSQGPAPPSRHITFSWPAHCVSSAINVMETAHWSPSRWCQHTLGVLPTLLQGRRTLLTWPPATARRPQAGSQHCSPAPPPISAHSPVRCVFLGARHLLRVHSCARLQPFPCERSVLPGLALLTVSVSVLCFSPGPLGLAVVPSSRPTPKVTVTALQSPRATLTKLLSTQPPSTLPSLSHRPLLETGVCQGQCSAS